MYIHACMYTHTCIHTHVHAAKCPYSRVNTHTHTHTHTHGVVLGGVFDAIGSNLARDKIFIASIGSVDSLCPSV